MNYYNQKIINRANNRNDNNKESNFANAENNLSTSPFSLNKNLYDNNPYSKPSNIFPSTPFENNLYTNNSQKKNLNYIDINTSNNSNINSYGKSIISSSIHNNHNIQNNSNNNVNINNNYSNSGSNYINVVATNPFNNQINAQSDVINKDSDTFFSNYSSSKKSNIKENEHKQEKDEDEEDELPLLEELGINFDLISKRMKSVFMFYKIDDTLFENSDLSGPLIIVLSLGFILLLAGKASFSYIYLIGIVSSLSIYLLLNMMSQNATLDLYRTISMLGYALLPLVILSLISIIINLRSKRGYSISFFCISWSALTASRFFEVVLLKRIFF
ncbi:protein transport protein YIP1, putative [Plasmodium malariae]|uniref:Protein transport protein YIP1, putative n=1 Tax=Plasmodium malariae TaxID=5858 RepID=A0A1C3L121_PLAMA|nr:protein transport protein YIP1, putative [Plasmodium malariae]